MKGFVVFVCADPRECSPWVAKWSNVGPASLAAHWSRRGEWQGISMVAIANGAGADRAYAAARSIEGASQMWNIGFGGAADPALGIGQIVAATFVRDGERNYACARPRVDQPFHAGVVRTVDAVVQDAKEKRDHYVRGASLIEMEAAGIARAAAESGAAFYCVRAVSDLANEDFENDFNAALRADGRFSPAALIAGAMGNPARRFGELIRLQKRTAFAAKNLGDFLAHCEF